MDNNLIMNTDYFEIKINLDKITEKNICTRYKYLYLDHDQFDVMKFGSCEQTKIKLNKLSHEITLYHVALSDYKYNVDYDYEAMGGYQFLFSTYAGFAEEFKKYYDVIIIQPDDFTFVTHVDFKSCCEFDDHILNLKNNKLIDYKHNPKFKNIIFEFVPRNENAE